MASWVQPILPAGVRWGTPAGGLDGLGSVPRLLLEPSSPHRSSQPACTSSRFVPVRTYGAKGLKIQYAGISTPSFACAFSPSASVRFTVLLAHFYTKSPS
jgi:hypothetical protein